MPKNKNSKTYEIALSGISCGIAVIFLALGVLSSWLTATGYFIGIIALMIPLSKRFYRGDFFAYLGTCLLSLIMGAAAKFWDIVPFIMFFGLHPLMNALQLKFLPRFKRGWLYMFLCYLFKALWFDGTLIAGYFLVFGGVLGGSLLPQNVYDFINQYIFLFVFTAGTVLFALYDFLVFRCQRTIDFLVTKIIK